MRILIHQARWSYPAPAAQIETTLSPLKDAGARMVVPLKVSGAFHSRMMEEPAREFGEFLEDFEFSTLNSRCTQMWRPGPMRMEVKLPRFSSSRSTVR